MSIIINKLMINNISALEMYEDDGVKNKPLIISVHGWSGRKEDMLPSSYTYAQSGFFAVIIDTIGHGERKCSAVSDNVITSLFDVVHNTTGEINMVIENYGGDSRVDVSRTGLTGVSMGGMVVYDYLVRENRRIKTAVPAISTPDFASVIEPLKKAIEQNTINEKSDGMTMEDIMRVYNNARETQPLNRYEKMKGIPILMVNGGSDSLIPIEGVRDFYSKLKTLYTEQDDVKLSVYEKENHFVNWDMKMEILEWFKEHL